LGLSKRYPPAQKVTVAREVCPLTIRTGILDIKCGHGTQTSETIINMPTYEYQAFDLDRSCSHCRPGFEIIQKMTESALTHCPQCKNPIYRLLFAPAVVIKGSPVTETEIKIKEYEKEGKWSHAAELADKEAEKTQRKDLKTRALEDYKKAGYDFDK